MQTSDHCFRWLLRQAGKATKCKKREVTGKRIEVEKGKLLQYTTDTHHQRLFLPCSIVPHTMTLLRHGSHGRVQTCSHYKGLEVCSYKYNFGSQLLSIPPFLCNVKRRTLAADHRRCGSTYQFHPQGSSNPRIVPRTSMTFCIGVVWAVNVSWPKQTSQSGCWGAKLL